MELLTRNVQTILPSEAELKKLLREKKRLRVKFGIDPTGPNIHIGRAVALWKLREFQEFGATIVLIFGDFTARIGDPSDKDKRRPALSEEQIKANTARYLEQIGNILDVKAIELHYNSAWHDTMSAADLIKLSRLFTVNQMLARRNFSQRMKEKKEIGIDEFLYPLLQGYDSFAVKADVELGGADQLFNLEAGRVVQSAFGQAPQCVLITKMLWGLDGRKMSTSWDNVVNIIDDPQEMFGKLMSLRDELTTSYLELTTRLSEGQRKEVQAIQNPKEQKERVAFEVVKLYHGASEAQKAKEAFTKVFSQKQLPDEIKEVSMPGGAYDPADLLVRLGLASSKSEARRLIKQGGVRLNGKALTDAALPLEITKGALITKGKRYVIKVLPA